MRVSPQDRMSVGEPEYRVVAEGSTDDWRWALSLSGTSRDVGCLFSWEGPDGDEGATGDGSPLRLPPDRSISFRMGSPDPHFVVGWVTENAPEVEAVFVRESVRLPTVEARLGLPVRVFVVVPPSGYRLQGVRAIATDGSTLDSADASSFLRHGGTDW